MGSANDVASSEFSSLVAANSFTNSGDMNANISIEDQYIDYENSGEKLEFTTSSACSLKCSKTCTSGCTAMMNGGCSTMCTIKCSPLR